VPQQRQQLAVIVADCVELITRCIRDGHNASAVVVALQTDSEVALHERAVRSAPVGARTDIAEQMEGQRSEGVATRVGAITGLVDIDTDFLVLRAMLLEFSPAAGSQRQAGAVVDGAALQRACSGDEARVVDVAASAIGLEHERSLPRHSVGFAELHVSGFAHDRQRQHTEYNLNPAQAGMERSGAARGGSFAA
jgi:hypothetical protein